MGDPAAPSVARGLHADRPVNSRRRGKGTRGKSAQGQVSGTVFEPNPRPLRPAGQAARADQPAAQPPAR